MHAESMANGRRSCKQRTLHFGIESVREKCGKVELGEYVALNNEIKENKSIL